MMMKKYFLIFAKVPKEISKYIINFTSIKDKSNIHNTVLLHPKDFSNVIQNFENCHHYRKNHIVLGKYGYNICCVADGYIRLFDRKDLFIKNLPKSIYDFPLKDMDFICNNCPFGLDNIPFERDLGTPVSDIYKRRIV